MKTSRFDTEKYSALCAQLGFRPDVRFVDITTRGTITFTCGKPDEIRALLRAVRKAGLRPSAALVAAALR